MDYDYGILRKDRLMRTALKSFFTGSQVFYEYSTGRYYRHYQLLFITDPPSGGKVQRYSGGKGRLFTEASDLCNNDLFFPGYDPYPGRRKAGSFPVDPELLRKRGPFSYSCADSMVLAEFYLSVP